MSAIRQALAAAHSIQNNNTKPSAQEEKERSQREGSPKESGEWESVWSSELYISKYLKLYSGRKCWYLI